MSISIHALCHLLSSRFSHPFHVLIYETHPRFPKSNEQYRIRGRLQYIGNNGPLYSYSTDTKEKDDSNDDMNNYFIAERKQQWGNLSDMAREQFYWSDPGITFTSTDEQA